MRIGIDAKWFFEGPISNKIVVQNLVKHIIEVNKENELYIILNKKNKDLKFPFQHPKVHLVYIWAGVNQVSNVFVIPQVAQKLKLEVVLFQNYVSFWGNFKKIAYIHDMIFLDYPHFFTWKERLYFATMPILARFSDFIITISESEKQRMIQHRIKKSNKIEVVYHGRDIHFQPITFHSKDLIAQVIQKYQLPTQFLLFVGRLNYRKNIQTLLQAIPLLKSQSIPLFIVGEKDWKSIDIQQISESLGISERIHLLGKVSFEELKIIYALATIFCFPSFAEGFGLPVLEAMVSGVPVVISENSALSEIAGEAGVVVNPHQPDSIAEGINQLLLNENFYQQKQVLGLQKSKEFDWNITAKKILIYLTEKQ